MENIKESLFDEYGRCIPKVKKTEVHKKSRRYFKLSQPDIDYATVYQRLDKQLNIGAEISLESFKKRAEAILEKLLADESSRNIVKGGAVPFILPKQKKEDIGTLLEEQYLGAVDRSFSDLFPEYSFENHCVSSLEGKLSIAKGGRHEELLATMEKDLLVGYYFPCLLEYSVPAAIEQLASMPKQFLLAGGFDTAAALIGTPSLLLRDDGYPPLLWLSGVVDDNEAGGHHFEAYGYDLTFNHRMHFNQAAESWCSGLVVLG